MDFLLQEKKTDNLCSDLFSALYRKEDPMTIEQLSDLLSVSKPTVSKGIDYLMKKKLLIDAGQKDTKTGRKPTLYKLNNKERYWLGIDLRMPDLTLALYDLSHNLVDHTDTIISKRKQREPDKLERLLIEKVKTFLEDQDIKGESILGIGAGVPGIVSQGSFSPFSRGSTATEYPIKEPLENSLGIPTKVVNDVDAELLSEIIINLKMGKEDTVLYFAARPSINDDRRVTIGGAIFHRGSLYRGKNGSSAEFGHTSVHINPEKELEFKPKCGNPNCLESYINAKLMNEKGDKIPSEVEMVLEEKLRDLIFSFTPNVILIDLVALPTIIDKVINNVRGFTDSLVGKWGHDKIKVKKPKDTTLACSRGATLNLLRELHSNGGEFPKFPSC